MVTVGALECIRTGTTTIVENAGRHQPRPRPRWRRPACAACSRSRSATARTLRARCRRRGSPGVRRPGSRPGCATRACSASTICSPPGTARSRDASACSRPPRSPRPRRPSCCRRSAPSPRNTISATRSTCRRAAPRSTSWCGTMACVRRRFSTRHGFLGPRLFAAHCRYVDEADIALLGRSGTIVSHQAAMAANRGVIPPIPALRAAGCPIANGTDNNTNDMFEVMRVALLTERIRRDDAFPGVRPQPEDMLEDATQAGARAVRQGTLIGSLEVGKKADLHRARHAAGPSRPGGAHRVGLDPQRSAVRHRVGDGRRPVRHAQPEGAHDGRGRHHRRSRQGRAADLEAGAGSRTDCDPGPLTLRKRSGPGFRVLRLPSEQSPLQSRDHTSDEQHSARQNGHAREDPGGIKHTLGLGNEVADTV